MAGGKPLPDVCLVGVPRPAIAQDLWSHELRGSLQGVGGRDLAVEFLTAAEIGQLADPTVVDKDVGSLDVTVKDFICVQVLKTL